MDSELLAEEELLFAVEPFTDVCSHEEDVSDGDDDSAEAAGTGEDSAGADLEFDSMD